MTLLSIVFVASLVFVVGSAQAEDARPLTVEQVIMIGNGLAALDGYDDVCRDGPSEKPCRHPYKFKGAARMTMAMDLAECRRISSAYTSARQDLIRQYAKGGNEVPPEEMSKFADDDKAAREHATDVKLGTIRSADLALDDNPIPPSVLSMIVPIVVDK